MEILQKALLAGWLKPRARDAHKGNFGHVLLVGGHPGTAGAVRMAAEAALRVGAGRVSVATHPRHADTLNAGRPEIMSHAIAVAADLSPLFARADVIVLGPGLGQSEWSRMVFDATVGEEKLRVLDAEGLALLAGQPRQNAKWILTPHPGEAGVLLGKTATEVQQDRGAAVLALQQTYGGVAVLKGAGTLVALPDGSIARCDAGNPGMATGGMGDVLCGVLGGLLAQGLPLDIAARGGVLLHAQAGDRAAVQGERGLLAMDLMAELRWLVNHLHD